MGVGDWNLRLKGAHSNREVIDLARDFIAQWTPAEIAELPESCRPGQMKGAEDLAYYAFALAKEERKSAACTSRLTTLASFLPPRPCGFPRSRRFPRSPRSGFS